MKFYDTDLESDHPPSDLQSDKDIPKEKLNRQKLLFKTDLFRVQKEIKDRGVSYQKPAYYDLVSFKMVEINKEQYDLKQFDELLSNTQLIQKHIQRPQNQLWLNKALTSMKQKQIAIYIHEYLKLDNNDLKVLEKTQYYLIEMIDWITYIDLYEDMSAIKKIINKGNGERCEICDEIDMHAKISQNNQIVYEQNTQGLKVIRDVVESKNILKILKTMKNGEYAIITMKDTLYREEEKQDLFLTQNHEDWIIEIKLNQLIKIDDLYGDGQLIKKSIYKGRSTAKPEKVSLIDFNLWIYKNSQNNIPEKQDLIYSSTQEDPCYQFKKIQKKDEDCKNLYQVFGSLQLYIDDLTVSKLMRKALLRMKKNELSIIKCFNTEGLVKNGVDYDGIMKKCNNIPQQLIYVIHVFDFTEGKNNFNMSINEKIDQALRKRQVGLKWISQNNFKKALKVFQAINAYFDYGTFSEEDRQKMRQTQISGLLNTSLCYLKLQDWTMMKHVCQKLYNLEKSNPKIIYRYCVAMKNLYEYEEALKILNDCQLNDYELINLKAELLKLEQQYLNKQKQVFQKFFE